MGLPKLVTVAFPYEGWTRYRLQTFLNPLKQATAEPSPHTSCRVAPGLALAAAICRLLYTLCQGTPDRTEVEADPDPHHLGNPRACTASRQFQTTSDLHLTTSTSHGGRWLLARGHSQSYQLSHTDLLTAIKTHLQEGALSPHRWNTSRTQSG